MTGLLGILSNPPNCKNLGQLPAIRPLSLCCPIFCVIRYQEVCDAHYPAYMKSTIGH